jgi:hypothetical protein
LEVIRGFVSVEGYVAREGAYDKPNQTFKYLLYSGLDGGKKGVLPAVMLFFKREAWDVEVGVATGQGVGIVKGVCAPCCHTLLQEGGMGC